MHKGTKKFTICMTKKYDVILFLVTLHYSDQKIIPITPVSLWWLYRPSGVCLTNLKMCHTLHGKKKEFPLTQISIASVMTKILRHRTPPSLRHPILMLYSQSFLNYFSFTFQVNLYFMYDYIWYFRCTS